MHFETPVNRILLNRTSNYVICRLLLRGVPQKLNLPEKCVKLNGTTYDFGTTNRFLRYAKWEVVYKQWLADVTLGQKHLI